jgi:hypothetical protein
MPGRRRAKAYTVSAPPPSIIAQRSSNSVCVPPSRALRLISHSLDISALLFLIGGEFLASFEFAQECLHGDKAVRVFECKLSLTAPQAQFM